MQQPGQNDVAAALSLTASIVEIIKNLTLTGALIYIIWGGKQGWWVYGWVYQATKMEAEYYRNLCWQLLGVTGSAVEGYKEQIAAQLLKPKEKAHP